jgi:serine/threonine-protein kinase
MKITAGTRVGPYEVITQIGAGGMGEVYRAHDTKLGRDIALKVLPENFATQADRVLRFRREAQVLAALNHPNIATIYGFEEAGDTAALALELVEGPTLADRLRSGAIGFEETLRIAKEVAEALEAAHEKGILHRDLKPANIKITAGGKVKVLDFGLAKILNEDTGPNPAISQSPTMMTAASVPGTILGTAAYMSPEQARGKSVDKRSDIWAFGVVLFELLTGVTPFDADTITDVFAKIVYKEPDWQKLPAETSPALVRLLRRCLAKDVRQRLHDIADARLEIENILQGEAVAPPQDHAVKRTKPLALAVGISLAAGALLGGGLADQWLQQRIAKRDQSAASSSPSSHTLIDLMEGAPLILGTNAAPAGDGTVVAISPQGTNIVYIGRSSSGSALYLRSLNSTELRSLPGTEGTVQAFFSPDGQWIGFLTNDKLKKISLQGGTPITLCDVSVALQGWWLQNDVIYISENQGVRISRVSADGGRASPVLEVAAIQPASAWRRRFSDVLPDGKYAIATAKPHGISDDFSEIELVSLETGQAKTLVRRGYGARYVPPGRILFARAGSLFSISFDIKKHEIEGEPVSIVSGVAMESLFGQVQAAASNNDILVFVPGGDRTIGRLAWVDRKGRTEFLEAPEKVYGVVNLSADGKRLAVHVGDVNDYIWIYDIEQRQGKRLNGPESQGWPIWNPDNRNIAFASIMGARLDVFMQNVTDGSAPRMIASNEIGYPNAFSPDGKTLFLSNLAGRFVRLDENAGAVDTDASLARFSTDGHWIFYVSTRTGREEVWVRSFPEGNGARQISTDGGAEPVWCKCGELFYRKGNQWYSTKLSTTPELRWETPRLVFQTEFIDTPGTSYDISPDGQRLLVVKRAVPEVQQKLHLLTNWSRAR